MACTLHMAWGGRLAKLPYRRPSWGLPTLQPTTLRGVAEIQRRSPGEKRRSPDSGIERRRRDGRPGSLRDCGPHCGPSTPTVGCGGSRPASTPMT